ncbi:hypothetical protein Xcc1_21400 [Xanthomonas campestris pv. campestris]|nr:hypothetical protein Xcc1_21400 [Xanthomonas campestris pv. campestris]
MAPPNVSAWAPLTVNGPASETALPSASAMLLDKVDAAVTLSVLPPNAAALPTCKVPPASVVAPV